MTKDLTKTEKQRRAGVREKTGRLPVPAVLLLFVLPVLTGLVCLCIGRVGLTVSDVFDAFRKAFSGEAENTISYVTVMRLRLPRILMAMCVGAGLSCAGCAFQSLFANPLATPDTVGVASGASFGAALGILFGFSMAGIQGVSFLMGIIAAALTFFIGRREDRALHTVILAGIMIGALFSALVSLVKFTADSETELPAITYFLMGSLSNANYRTLLYGAVPIVLSIIVLFLLRWRLNLLPYGEDEVRTLGVNMQALRLVTIILATLLSASCVSMCGQVGWIGLLVPHMCRMLFKNNHMSLIPASVSIGAAFMVIVDTIARSVTAAEIPVSVLTALIGAPFFIFLMRKSGGWKL